MKSISVKLKNKTFTIDEISEKFAIGFLEGLEHLRRQRFVFIFDKAKEKIVSENPNISKIKLEHELNYILSDAGYNHSDIARYLRIDRTTSNKNCERVKNDLWAENRLSISEKTMSKRIEEMKNYIKKLQK
jgi:hypothetical protein